MTGTDPRHATPDRVEIVDDYICDLLVALSRKSVKADPAVERRLIRRTAEHVVNYCDSHPPLRVTASGPIVLTEATPCQGLAKRYATDARLRIACDECGGWADTNDHITGCSRATDARAADDGTRFVGDRPANQLGADATGTRLDDIIERQKRLLQLLHDTDPERHTTGTRVTERAWRDVAAKLYGRYAFAWADDEPNRATARLLRVTAADFADDLLDAIHASGWEVVQK
jgi:hypothetical protein